jgi:hypothetical protein
MGRTRHEVSALDPLVFFVVFHCPVPGGPE